MNALRVSFAVIASLLCMSWSVNSRADVFHLSYGATAADPAETFDQDCLNDTPAEDCDTRAALIQGELVTLLSRLESDEDPATLALFQAALSLDSPVVQAMAMRYLTRAKAEPDDFFSKVKTFFFGTDASLGVASTEALWTSKADSDQQLAELYSEQRPGSAYASQLVTDDHTDNKLLSACIQDARLERMASFGESQRFAPAERLLMYDRFVRATFVPGEDYPLTAFVTDASLDEVKKFFTQRFGEPLGPVAGAAERLGELTLELQEAQSAAMSGNQAAIKRLQEVVEEMVQTQKLTSLDAYLQLSANHADHDLVWIEGNADDVALQVPRTVTAGRDSLLGRTVIRYVNAPTNDLGGSVDGDGGESSGGESSGGESSGGESSGGESSGGESSGGRAGAPSGSGNSPGQGGVPSDAGAPAEGGGTSAGSDSGCGCAMPGSTDHGSGLAALSLLALCVWRARRSR